MAANGSRRQLRMAAPPARLAGLLDGFYGRALNEAHNQSLTPTKNADLRNFKTTTVDYNINDKRNVHCRARDPLAHVISFRRLLQWYCTIGIVCNGVQVTGY